MADPFTQTIIFIKKHRRFFTEDDDVFLFT